MKYAGKVKAEFIRAVELDPNNLTHRSGLLSYYLMAPSIVGGSVSKVREQAEALLRLDAYEGKGMRTEALSFFRQFLSFNPSGESAETAQNKVEELQK